MYLDESAFNHRGYVAVLLSGIQVHHRGAVRQYRSTAANVNRMLAMGQGPQARNLYPIRNAHAGIGFDFDWTPTAKAEGV